ncbi:MAG: hypothetical protein R3E67_06170 [Pseudomonadales bacterium]
MIILGGPHVQQVEDYLLIDPIDAIANAVRASSLLSNGWIKRICKTGAALMVWHSWKMELRLLKHTNTHHRFIGLPGRSALEVIPLTDDDGKPLYESVAYETSRGCPFKCSSFVSGAPWYARHKNLSVSRCARAVIGKKIVTAGIANIWQIPTSAP